MGLVACPSTPAGQQCSAGRGPVPPQHCAPEALATHHRLPDHLPLSILWAGVWPAAAHRHSVAQQSVEQGNSQPPHPPASHLLHFLPSFRVDIHTVYECSSCPRHRHPTPFLGRSLQCGCQCTSCCFWPDDDLLGPDRGKPEGDPPCFTGEEALALCTPTNRPSLVDECRAYNEENCGLEWSLPSQVFWCEIAYPAEQPPYVPVSLITQSCVFPSMLCPAQAALFLLFAAHAPVPGPAA